MGPGFKPGLSNYEAAKNLDLDLVLDVVLDQLFPSDQTSTTTSRSKTRSKRDKRGEGQILVPTRWKPE